MEQTKKVKKHTALLVSASVFLTVSLIVFCIGMSILDWDFRNLDLNTYTEKSWTGEAGDVVTELDIKVDTSNVTINVAGALTAPSVEYFESETRKVSVEFAAGKLKVRETYQYKFFNIFNFEFGAKAMTITIPESLLTKVEFKQSAGNATLNGLEAVNANIKISAGTLKLNNVQVHEELKIDQSAGASELKNCTTTKAEIKISAGALKLTNFAVEDLDVKISAGALNGNIIGTKSEYTITVHKSAGSCNLSPQTGSTDKKVAIDISAGSVNLSIAN